MPDSRTSFRKEQTQYQKDDANRYRNICNVEYRKVRNRDEINDTLLVDEPIEYIPESAAENKTERQIVSSRNIVDAQQSDEQNNTDAENNNITVR